MTSLPVGVKLCKFTSYNSTAEMLSQTKVRLIRRRLSKMVSLSPGIGGVDTTDPVAIIKLSAVNRRPSLSSIVLLLMNLARLRE